MSKLSPKSVFITGANRGLGLAFVKHFLGLAEPPSHVFAACRQPDQATELTRLAGENGRVRVVKLDVREDEEIAAAVVEVEKVVGAGGLNLLLNNAGVNQQEQGLESLTREKMNYHFDCNVTAPLLVSKAFLPLLRRAANKTDFSCSRAAIINVSTVLSLINYVNKMNDFRYPYDSSKCALNMVTDILAREVSPDGVLVAGLHPGWVKTDMGGPNAMLDIEESISKCMNTIAAMNKDSSGLLYSYAGTVFHWNAE
ncbi:C-factor-like isoform X3 [Haliotis rubra]|uniref:C-factor-like isoform X3 n=1 Tax=Haliotis rubra TaxID=36100 RepID=UPI001EE555F7|nr:C-factor-like isoform X3 [Haliotis rubra]